MQLTLNSTFRLNDGVEIPVLGLGTWTLSGKSAKNAVLWALGAGYRLIDTATIYGNERWIGKALTDTSVSRDDLFITTKVWDTDHGHEDTLSSFSKSLKRLKLSYIDLYLIHWPNGGKLEETWKALEYLKEEGKVRSIGVSNYTVSHLKDLLDYGDLTPSVNQVEFHPFLYQEELLEFCRNHDIRLEAYSPLTRAYKLDHPVLKELANKHDKSTAQILLRWGLQHGIVEIPKSGSRKHIQENANVFEFSLEQEDMTQLDGLNESFRVVEDSIFSD